jgi:hypothetical protein
MDILALATMEKRREAGTNKKTPCREREIYRESYGQTYGQTFLYFCWKKIFDFKSMVRLHGLTRLIDVALGDSALAELVSIPL